MIIDLIKNYLINGYPRYSFYGFVGGYYLSRLSMVSIGSVIGYVYLGYLGSNNKTEYTNETIVFLKKYLNEVIWLIGGWLIGLCWRVLSMYLIILGGIIGIIASMIPQKFYHNMYDNYIKIKNTVVEGNID